MYSTTDFRKNLKIEINGEPYVILECQHVKPGKGVAFVKTRYKSLISGRVLEENFRSGDKVQVPNLEANKMQYLYMEDGDYVFMDTTSYEQIRLLGSTLEHVAGFMKDNIEVDVLFHNGNPISVDLPTFIEATIVQVDPGFKGDTVQGGTKPATIESGAVIQVPLYIKQGELIRIDTRTSEYVERVNK